MIIPESDFLPEERKKAKEYWSGIGVNKFYDSDTHWADYMAEQIISLRPKRVLEFGCNIGRNLRVIRDKAPDINLTGVDINKEAVLWGRSEYDLNLFVGDEEYLRKQKANTFDLVFTISVLAHMADPFPPLEEMLRISINRVLLLEPWLGSEGKILKNISAASGELVDTTPYSYSWDYSHFAKQRNLICTAHHYPLKGTNLGKYYYFYSIQK